MKTIEEKKEFQNLYFDSIDYKAIETTNKLLKELEKINDFELISCKKMNAIYLHDKTKKINNCINSWFGYVLNNYYVYFQFDYFWLFEGISISAYPINKNGTYNTNKYSLKFKNPIENFNDLLGLLKNPKKINDNQKCIYPSSKNDIEYMRRNRKIEKHIY